MLPWSFIERHRVLPIEATGNVLRAGFVDDPTPKVLTAVRQLLPSMELEPVRISRGMFERFLASRSGLEAWQEEEEPGELPAAKVVEPPARLKSLLERMVAEGASDLHLLPGRQPTWRIDGDIQTIEDAAVVGESEVYDLLRPVMEQRHLEEFDSQRDVDLGYTLEGLGRFRINMYRSYHGIGAAFRVIPSQILSVEQLGLPSVIKNLCLQPKGLVVVTGPTGSGKSTTLAAMIDFINRTKKVHIVTLEDPIEFVHADHLSMVNQREIGGHAVSFARGLRAALREDPDIVLVGEMRDRETAALALEVANTGHLVFTTLHTNSAISTVERIVEMFPSEVQAQVRAALSDVLRAVVSQTLCKRRGGGRVAALEILVGGVAVANVIREGKTAQLQNLMQSGGKEGNILLNQYLARLVKDRKVLKEEALEKAVDKKDLTLRLSKLMAPPPTAKS
jgi:twitching motility protein PilT